MEPAKARGYAHQRIAAQDKKILIQTDNARREASLPLVFAMRIGDANCKRAILRGPGIARQGPVRIERIK